MGGYRRRSVWCGVGDCAAIAEAGVHTVLGGQLSRLDRYDLGRDMCAASASSPTQNHERDPGCRPSGCPHFASPIFGSAPGLGFVIACFFAGVECQSFGRSSATQGAEPAFWGVGGHPVAFVVQRSGSVHTDALGMLVRAAERRATNRCGVW